jgi:hypothetical protein
VQLVQIREKRTKSALRLRRSTSTKRNGEKGRKWPNSLDVLVCYGLNVETDGGDGGDGLVELELVENGCEGTKGSARSKENAGGTGRRREEDGGAAAPRELQ